MRRLADLIDRAWPRLPLALLGVTALVALGAILTADGDSDHDQIADAVHAFGRDVADHEAEQACARMTPAAQQAVVAIVPTVDCPTYIRSFSLEFDARALASATLGNVQIEGDNAVIANTQLRNGDTPLGTGFALQRSGGTWLIAGILK